MSEYYDNEEHSNNKMAYNMQEKAKIVEWMKTLEI